jgi:hypothetical protein
MAGPAAAGMISAVKPLTDIRTLVLWLALFAPVAVWIGWQEQVDRYERFFQDTSIAQRMPSQKVVQHEAVLAALSHPPSPAQLLPSLQPAMPQLLGLGYMRGGAWVGSVAAPAGMPATLEQAHQLGRPVALAVDQSRYWLVAPSSWSLLLDARRFIPAADFPPTLAIMENAQKNPGAANLADIPGFLLLGGGVPVRAGDSVLGAIGVAGPPGGPPGGHLDAQRADEVLAANAALFQ